MVSVALFRVGIAQRTVTELPFRVAARVAAYLIADLPDAFYDVQRRRGVLEILDLIFHGHVITIEITRDALARVRQATVEDVGAIIGVIAPLEADGTLVARGRERLEMEIERFSVLEVDEVIIGCAALYPFANDRAGELACLAVMPEYRREGYGEALLHHVEMRARKRRLQDLFVLTTRTAHWFVERGFCEAPIDSLPRRRRDLYNLQRRSKVLIKPLATES